MILRTMIDLFSGAGGLSCGLEQAGFSPIFANEKVAQFAETYKINHPSTRIIVGDVRDIDINFLRGLINRYSDIDLIAGGPPCQGFSINAPVRSLEDSRNHLFREYLRIVNEVKPKAVLIENVPGIISLGSGTVVSEIYDALNKMGYKVDHRILFAGHYGIPQLRFRTIFIGMRNYNDDIAFPQPEYYVNAVANFQSSKELCYTVMPLERFLLKPKTTVWDAISDLPELKGGEKLAEYDYVSEPQSEYQMNLRFGSEHVTSHWCSKLSEINKQRLKYIPIGGSWRDIPFELLPAGLKKSRRSDHTKRYGRLDPQELCSTIMTKCDPHWGSFFHPYQERILSVREAARIQSFPDKYQFTGSMTEQYEQVGNAVPPLLAKAIGICIDKMLRGS